MNNWITTVLILVSIPAFALAFYLLSKFNRLFPGIRNVWLRKNLTVALVGLCLMVSVFPATAEIFAKAAKYGWVKGIIYLTLQTLLIVFFVFNATWLVLQIKAIRRLSFVKKHAVVILTIIIAALFIYATVNYVGHDFQFKEIKLTLIFAFYNALTSGLIYTALNYVDLERQRKLKEKELEVAQLTVLKTKAELDALHSKVNPHFLYNALNSIADLAITDGRKARRMTIALADLFRYSINYSQNNYSTLADEIEMVEVYLQIEKIRFEDQLNYSVAIQDEARHYLVPRFLLQPLAENAVKHGLKATGRMTEILLEVKLKEKGMEIVLADNGPEFPDELTPGYGLKSVFDKLDLLFPDEYEIHFANTPRKQVLIVLNKLMKNEPSI